MEYHSSSILFGFRALGKQAGILGVNIRVGAGTNHTVIDSANKGDAVTIVLTATDKDGDKWYKIKRGSGYGYIFSKYVSVGTASNAAVSSYSAERSSSVEADAGSIVAIKDAP